MQFQSAAPADLLAALEKSSGMLSSITTASGATPEAFAKQYAPLLHRLASYVQECPLERATHADPGGALRFGLISGLMSLRIAESMIFQGQQPAEVRRRLEPQYRFAAFVAAVASVPGLVHGNMEIMSADGEFWTPLDPCKTLLEWLRTRGNAYSIKWRSEQQRPSAMWGAFIAGSFVEQPIWQTISEQVACEAVDAIMASVVPGQVESALMKCVRMAGEKAREIDKRTNSRQYIAPPPTTVSAAMLQEPLTEPLSISPAPQLVAPSAGQASGQINTEPLAAPAPDPLKQLEPALRDWVKMVPAHKDFAKMQPLMVWTDRGLEFPARALGAFGVSTAAMIKMLEAAKVVDHKTDKSVILKAWFGEHILPREKAAA
jgi:conjugal transfer pilus assembly protein TraI